MASTSELLLKVDADTRKAIKEFDKLRRAEEKAAAKTKDAAKEKSNSLEAQVAGLAKVTAAVTAGVVAFNGLREAAEFYAKRSQLVAASAGKDIESIQAAARGLLSEQEALSFAAATTNTQFAISQQEMETVAQAMVSLRNQGNDFVDVQRRLTQAIVEGNAEALRPLGITIKAASGEMETAKLVMEALRVEADKLATQGDLAGDGFLRQQVAMRDSIDDTKDALGSLVDALEPMLLILTAAAKAVGAIAEGWALILNSERRRQAGGGVGGTQADISRLTRERDEFLRRRERLLGRGITADTEGGAGESFRRNEIGVENRNRRIAELTEVMKMRAAASAQVEAQAAAQAKEAAALQARIAANTERMRDAMLFPKPSKEDKDKGTAKRPTVVAIKEAEPSVFLEPMRGIAGVISGGKKPFDAGGSIGEAAPGSGLAGLDGFQSEQEKLAALTDALRGPVDVTAIAYQQLGIAAKDSADSVIKANFESVASFDMFASAANASFAAWASGSMSAAEAFKSFIGTSLAGLAANMFAKSLEHTAMGVAALFLNPAAAGTHFTAAGLFASGAVAVGGLARRFGGSAPNETQVPRTTAPAAARGQGAAQPVGGGSQTLIFASNPFDDNPREARRRLARAMDRAREERGSRSGTLVVRE